MNSRETQRKINDYLDLYLYAGRIGDTSWQHEILETLQNFHATKEQETEALPILWKQFKETNDKIAALYSQLRNQSNDHNLWQKIWELKQQRISLGRQIRSTRNPSQKIS